MSKTDGQWWTKPWNPIRVKGGGYHCTKISPGCLNCWAEQINNRFGNGIPYSRFRFDKTPVEYEINQKVLERPLHWRKPQQIFVCDMCDLFHEQIPARFIGDIFCEMGFHQRHIYYVLTKRPQRCLDIQEKNLGKCGNIFKLCPPNLWFGVSVENQKTADERIPLLLQIPAAHRFINFEPLLEDIIVPLKGVRRVNGIIEEPKINQVIIGSESGSNRRPCELNWVRNIVQQCKTANVPVWIKQLSINGKVSHNMAEWPLDLRIRQWPK